MKYLLVTAFVICTSSLASAAGISVFKCGPFADAAGNADTTVGYKLFLVGQDLLIEAIGTNGTDVMVQVTHNQNGSYNSEETNFYLRKTGNAVTSITMAQDGEVPAAKAECLLVPQQ